MDGERSWSFCSITTLRKLKMENGEWRIGNVASMDGTMEDGLFGID